MMQNFLTVALNEKVIPSKVILGMDTEFLTKKKDHIFYLIQKDI